MPAVDIARTYLAWTSIDPTHSLNLLYPAYLPVQPTSKLTLRETGLGGPALGYFGGSTVTLRPGGAPTRSIT